MKRGARGRVEVVRSTSELIGMRPLGQQQQQPALFVACSPSRDHSSGRYRGPMGQKAREREGEAKRLSVAMMTVWLKPVVWEHLGEDCG